MKTRTQLLFPLLTQLAEDRKRGIASLIICHTVPPTPLPSDTHSMVWRRLYNWFYSVLYICISKHPCCCSFLYSTIFSLVSSVFHNMYFLCFILYICVILCISQYSCALFCISVLSSVYHSILCALFCISQYSLCFFLYITIFFVLYSVYSNIGRALLSIS